jgi:hypothetical protein
MGRGTTTLRCGASSLTDCVYSWGAIVTEEMLVSSTAASSLKTSSMSHSRRIGYQAVRWVCWSRGREGTYTAYYLVDPASSHMLVSKIKPCRS